RDGRGEPQRGQVDQTAPVGTDEVLVVAVELRCIVDPPLEVVREAFRAAPGQRDLGEVAVRAGRRQLHLQHGGPVATRFQVYGEGQAVFVDVTGRAGRHAGLPAEGVPLVAED